MKRILFFAMITLLHYTAQAQAPELFLPDIMKNMPNVRDMCISANGDEIYFSMQSFKKEYASIVQLTKKNNEWNSPEIASFSGQYTDIEPVMSTNGLKLYFASNRPKDENNKVADFDIWFVTRNSISEPWSEPINIGAPINTDNNEYYPSIAENGNIYYTASYNNGKGKEDIFLAEFKDGVYESPYSLSDAINTEGWEFNAYVAPDELYIIFTSTSHDNNIGGGDLYISFKDNENNWVKAENLGISINSPKLDFCPFVDTKTNTFYFSSEKTTINKSFNEKQSIDELLEKFNEYPNGMTRIYSLPFECITK